MVNEYDLTLFIREESDLYRKYEELHYQKAYELEQVKEALLQEAWSLWRRMTRLPMIR